jgi:hypothetical protein
VRIVELCSAADVVEAQELCNVLQEEGVQAKVAGGSLANAAGGLPFGETIAPRVWVRESDVMRAREILDRRRAESGKGLADWPESDGRPEWETPVEPEDGPLPSDRRFGFLNQGFYIAGLACVVYGSIWAWQNGIVLSTFSATTTGRLAGSSFGGMKSVPVPGGPDQPARQRPAIVFLQNVQYAYIVDKKTYYAEVRTFDTAPARVIIHYDPRDPSKYIFRRLAPPGVVLAFAFGLGAFLMFVGYQFRWLPS